MWISDPDRYIPDRLDMAKKVIVRCKKSNAGCFEWQGAVTRKGYGRVKIDGKVYSTHRLVAFAAGIIPTMNPNPSNYVLHECDNPSCCNPDHMKRGTQRMNMQDCSKRGRAGNMKPSNVARNIAQ